MDSSIAPHVEVNVNNFLSNTCVSKISTISHDKIKSVEEVVNFFNGRVSE